MSERAATYCAVVPNTHRWILPVNEYAVRSQGFVPYEGDYEKDPYDLILTDGRECGPYWPNAGDFHRLVHDEREVGHAPEHVRGSEVAWFRLTRDAETRAQFCLDAEWRQAEGAE